jgi:site-specific DNA-methyltransferase (adenine-specific)
MGHMPDNLIDLVITSPPYDNLRSYHGYLFDFENIARALFKAVKAGGVIVWVVGDQTQNGSESASSFKQVLYFKELGFNLHDTMIYKKGHPIPLNHNRYEQEFEYMFILSKGRPKTFNPIMIPCKLSGVKTGKRTFYQTKDQDAPTMAHKVAPVKETKIKGNIWEIYNSERSRRSMPLKRMSVIPLFSSLGEKETVLLGSATDRIPVSGRAPASPPSV